MITEDSKVDLSVPANSPDERRQMFERLFERLKLSDQKAKERAEEFRRRRTAPPEEQKPFWGRPANAELDRVGDWILANHLRLREESIDRGEPL